MLAPAPPLADTPTRAIERGLIRAPIGGVGIAWCIAGGPRAGTRRDASASGADLHASLRSAPSIGGCRPADLRLSGCRRKAYDFTAVDRNRTSSPRDTRSPGISGTARVKVIGCTDV